jgi:hypothetical protein
MPDLTRRQRLDIVAELCPKFGSRRACDSYELARERALEILGPPERAEVTADYVLMRAIDRYVAGQIDERDLYRCRVLAYYMIFASGGEEWDRWGVVAKVNPGGFQAPLEEADLDKLLPPVPEGPPWGGVGR